MKDDDKKQGVLIVGGDSERGAYTTALTMALGNAYIPYILDRDTAPGLNKYLNRKNKQAKKCLLPSCNNLTTHRGGYCCKEHCEEYRRILGGKK